jgi:hypothetical protein
LPSLPINNKDMRTTKKFPVKITISYPDGQLLESRIPLWKAYAIMAELERENAMKVVTNKQERK